MERDAILRKAMVGALERAGALRSAQIASAMRAVPRHRFLKGLPPEDAYADRAIAIKSGGGQILSSISQPSMIAVMLEFLSPRPGDRVLEVGTGSGYHAALLAELVGPTGSVTTTDLDAELAGAARATLRDLGYDRVTVLVADGTAPLHERAPYDRIVVTARCDDVAAAWWDALGEGARLVVPLRLEGAGEYAVGFARCGERLESVGQHPCAFLALRGASADDAGAELFYRDPEQRSGRARVRAVSAVRAVRRNDARPWLLEGADVIVARSVTVFAVSFAS